MNATLKNKGFTLQEIVIVIALIGVLAIALVPKLSNLNESAKDKGVLVGFKTIDENMKYFKMTERRLPNLTEFNSTIFNDFTFEIKNAIITVEDEVKYIALRTESSVNSTYDQPYGLSFIMKYQDIDGLSSYIKENDSKDETEKSDVEYKIELTDASKALLANYNPNLIVSVIGDSMQSNVDELKYVND